MTDAVRLFFAALPDAPTLERVEAAVAALPPEARQLPVLRRNYHVTVAFVGAVPRPQLPTVLAIGAAQRAHRFALRFDAYEYWPKPEVVVAAARSTPPALELLWRSLHAALAAHQWALDPKRLRPHVTLARKISQAPVLQTLSSFEWPVREFSLLRSDTGGAQSAYTVVGTWPLLDDTPAT